VVLDFRNLTRGEQIAGLAGVALLVIMLVFKWYGLRAEGLIDGTREGATRNAFQSFTITDFLLLLTALAAIALPLWIAAGRQLPRPFAPGTVVAALGPASRCRHRMGRLSLDAASITPRQIRTRI
jgi:hypothetical protein